MSTDGKHWWEYVDPTVTLELLDGTCRGWVVSPPPLQGTELRLCVVISELTHEFLQILEKTPSRLKRIRNWKVNVCVCSFQPPRCCSGVDPLQLLTFEFDPRLSCSRPEAKHPKPSPNCRRTVIRGTP